MRRMTLFLALAAVIAAGCGEDEPELPPPPEPTEAPKKTAEQLAAETMQKLDPLLKPNNPRAFPAQAIVTDAKNKYRPPAEPNGEEALSQIKRDLGDRFDKAYRAGQWNLVVALAGVLDIFAKGPPERAGELKKNDRYRQRALAELSKPQVTVTGFVDDYVGLSIKVPPSNEKISEYVREGDSFLDDPNQPGEKLLRLEEIIGDNREVRIYYYKTDTSWTVKGPRG